MLSYAKRISSKSTSNAKGIKLITSLQHFLSFNFHLFMEAQVLCHFNPKLQSSRGCRWGGIKSVQSQVQLSFYSHIFLLLRSAVLFLRNMLLSIWETGEKRYLKNKSTAYSKSWFRHPLKDMWLPSVIHLSSSSGKHQTPLVCLPIKWYFSHHQSISNRERLRSTFEKHLLTHSWSSCPGGLFLMKAP